MIAKMFDLVQKYEKIETFLGPYNELWDGEILNEFPRIYGSPIEKWAKLYQELSCSEKAERLSNYSPLNDSDHQELLSQINELIKLPQSDIVDSSRIYKVNEKKSHEIHQILNFYKNKKITNLYDFAGGVGHTSEQLSKNLNICCHCLDIDKNLIETGIQRTQEVHFHHYEIHPNMKLSLELPADILALHCCGDLSQNLVDYFPSSNAKSLLNLGCCYHKIDNHSFCHQARYLATRSHGMTSEEDIKEREQFKTYRYSFGLLLNKFYDLSPATTLKSSLPELYQGNFIEYAEEQLKRLELSPLKSCLIEDFFNSNDTLQQVKRLINLGHVRAPFGRLIEIQLVLKRAIELKEKGFEVQVFELFDRAISPRNIAIYAQS